MAITVKFFANFREAAGQSQAEVDGVADLGSLFEELSRRFGRKLAHQLYSGEARELRDSVHVLINGRFVDPAKRPRSPLKSGDVVAIFPPVSGGSLNVNIARRRCWG